MTFYNFSHYFTLPRLLLATAPCANSSILHTYCKHYLKSKVVCIIIYYFHTLHTVALH